MILLVVTIFALCCSAFFAFSETSIFSIPREKYEILKNENGGGRKIYEILMKSNLFLVFLLLGNNFVNIIAISGLENLLSTFFNNNLALVFLCATAIILIFGEIMPKVIAVGNYMFIARIVAPVIAFTLKYCDGFLKKINSFNLYILRMNYRYLLQTPHPFVTGDEYAVAIKEAVANKKISENAGEMITEFIDLTQKNISKIARNRNSIKIIKNIDEKNKLFEDEIAILYENDEIKSVFYKTFGGVVKELSPMWFPNTKTIGDLHNYFLQNDCFCVLLLDEYGGFDGAVGRYDIYNYWKALNCGGEETLSEITLDGSDEIVKYREWVEQNALEKYSQAKTFNGFLCLAAGKIPEIGDTVAQGKFIYGIIDADRTKIKKIKIKKEYDFPNT